VCSTFLSLIVTDFKSVNTEIIINNHYSDEFTNHPELSNASRRGINTSKIGKEFYVHRKFMSAGI